MENTNNKKASLTKEETSELQRCEAIIDAGLKTFVEVGKALQTINEARLYRLTHSTFDLYVRDRFKITNRRAYEFIRAAKAVAGLKGEALNEAQAKALGKIDADKRKAVLAKAKKAAAARGKRATAKDIHNASGKHTAYTVVEFSKELGGLVNKAKAEGISLLDITNSVGAIHAYLIKLCKEGNGNGGTQKKAA